MKLINLKRTVLIHPSHIVPHTSHGGENIVKHKVGLGTTFTINLPL